MIEIAHELLPMRSFFYNTFTNYAFISLFRPTDGMTVIFSYHLMLQLGFLLTPAQLHLLEGLYSGHFTD